MYGRPANLNVLLPLAASDLSDISSVRSLSCFFSRFADFLLQTIDFHFLLGDGLHVFANFGHDVFDYVAGPIDFKLGRHRLFHGIGHPTRRCADIAGGVPPKTNNPRTATPKPKKINRRIMAIPSIF